MKGTVVMYSRINSQENQKENPDVLFDNPDKTVYRADELPFQVNTNPSRPMQSLNLSKIPQKQIMVVAKAYVFLEGRKNRSMSTLEREIASINYFANFLDQRYPSVKSLEELRVEIFDEFLLFLAQSDYATRTQENTLTMIRKFLMAVLVYEWVQDIPGIEVLENHRNRYKSEKLPKPLTKKTIDQLKSVVNSDLRHPQLKRALLVMTGVCLRPSEVCSLTIDSIKYDREGDPYLDYYQTKTHSMNKFPISSDILGLLNEAIEQSRRYYGSDVKYIFSRNKNKSLSYFALYRAITSINKTGKIKDDMGKAIKIELGQFRDTVATEMVCSGKLSLNEARSILGHKSISSILNYVDLQNQATTKELKTVLKIHNEIVKRINRGNWSSNEIEDELNPFFILPLMNGYCFNANLTGSTLCNKGNGCYNCRSFLADPRYLVMYQEQRNRILEEIENLEQTGPSRTGELLQRNLENLEKVINWITDS